MHQGRGWEQYFVIKDEAEFSTARRMVAGEWCPATLHYAPRSAVRLRIVDDRGAVKMVEPIPVAKIDPAVAATDLVDQVAATRTRRATPTTRTRRATPTVDVSALVRAVKNHAHANYERGGWDYIVETYTDAELAEAIGSARTVAGAIRKVGAIARLLGDRRDDVMSTAW